jgi:pimeloyl-ACP methyl ester carboxylesterase
MVATARAPEAPIAEPTREQSRARYPDATGFVEREGGRVAWEAYGSGDPPIVFVPPWQIVHSRIWKAQIPYFARQHRVIAWDNLGSGRSDRPLEPLVHTTRARAANLGAVVDAADVPAAVLVGLSSSSGPMVVFASEHPARVLGLVFVAPAAPIGDEGRFAEIRFEEVLATEERWAKENIHFWRRDYRAYLEFFFSEAFPEAHSTKQREDGVGWGLETDPESLAATKRAPPTVDAATFTRMAASIRAPTLVIQGTAERLTHITQGTSLADAIPGARLVLIESSGHMVNARDPVRVNLLIRDFIRSLQGRSADARSRA